MRHTTSHSPPAPSLRGRVLDEAGRPVPGAAVHLATWSQPIQDRTGLVKPDATDGGTVITDEHGRFTFPAQFERYALLATHDFGFARSDGDCDRQPGDLTLRPWASVEGCLLAGGRPAANEHVGLTPIASQITGKGLPRVLLWQDAATDAEGRFRFERVVPVPSNIAARINPWDASQLTSGESRPIDVAPGRTASVILGAPGRIVAGRVIVRGESAASLDLRYSRAYLIQHHSAIEVPELSVPQWRDIAGWDDAMDRTPEGRAALAGRHTFTVKVNADGSFRAEGLPAGRYDMRIQLYDDPKGGCLIAPVAVRTLTIDVLGPEGSTIDVGVEVGGRCA